MRKREKKKGGKKKKKKKKKRRGGGGGGGKRIQTKTKNTKKKKKNNGWFFYKPTKEQFETVRCHILSISKGFSTDKMGGKEGETTYNHILAGIMLKENRYSPFIVYLNSAGHRNKMYTFGKEIHQYTHMKPLGIPMFVLTVKMFTIQVPYSYTDSKGVHTAKAWVLDYEVEKNEDGTPVLIGDPKEFKFLKESVLKA